MRVYNGENMAITVVTDSSTTVIDGKSFATVETDAPFNSDSFYIEEDGAWYAKENGPCLEIYIGG